MHIDQMPNKVTEFVRNWEPVLMEKGQVLGHAHFIAIDRKCIQPNTALRKLRVVVLRFQAKGIIIFSNRPHQEPAFGDVNYRRRLSKLGNLLKMTI